MLNNRQKMITTPIFNILEKTVTACTGLSDGVENESIKDYIFKSAFLEMTGMLEQKMQEIAWVIASNAPEYRFDYDHKNGKWDIGLGSTLDDKRNVFSLLQQQIILYDHFDQLAQSFSDNQKKELLHKICKDFRDTVTGSPIVFWNHRSFDEIVLSANSNSGKTHILIRSGEQLRITHFCTVNRNQQTVALINCNLDNYYKEIIYNHRNQFAHNLGSLHSPMQKLKEMTSKYYIGGSFLTQCFVMVLIDEIFMKTFKIYLRSQV
jgi:hypothetical protein